MKDITQLHEAIRRKYREEGILDIAAMLELQEERKTENAYATKLGLRQPLGIEEGKEVDPNRTVIGFYVGRDVVFLGDQAVVVKGIIEEYVARLRLGNQEGLEGSDRMTIARVENNRLRMVKVNGDTDQLTLWGAHWNDWLRAIFKMDVAFMVFSIEETS